MDEKFFNRAQRRAMERRQIASTNAEQMTTDELYRFAECAFSGDMNRIPFFGRAQRLSGLVPMPAEEFGTLTDYLYKRYFHSKPFPIILKNLYYLTKILLLIQERALQAVRDRGEAIPSHVPLVTQEALIMRIALSLFSKDIPNQRFQREAIQNVIRGDDVFSRSFDLLLEYDMEMLQLVAAYAKKLQERLVNEMGLALDAAEFRSQARELFTYIKELQCYTIKQCCIENDLIHLQGGAWVILDPRQARYDAHDTYESAKWLKKKNDGLAMFVLALEMEKVTDLNVSGGEREFGFMRTAQIKFPFPIGRGFVWSLDDERGELWFNRYPLRIPLKQVFDAVGAGDAYDFLKLVFTSYVFDMLVPKRISDQVPSLQNIRKKLEAAQQNGDVRGVQKIIRDISLPRILMAKNRELLKQAFAEEADEIEKHKRQFLGRVGHPRKLSDGCKPHPDAKKWAEEDGFLRELEPNETWCRPIDSPMPVVHRQKRTGGKKKEGIYE